MTETAIPELSLSAARMCSIAGCPCIARFGVEIAVPFNLRPGQDGPMPLQVRTSLLVCDAHREIPGKGIKDLLFPPDAKEDDRTIGNLLMILAKQRSKRFKLDFDKAKVILLSVTGPSFRQAERMLMRSR